MKKYDFLSITLLLVLLSVVYNPSYAQENSKTEPLTYAEHMPQFQGDLPEYISKHLTYPDEAREKKVEGFVITQFVVLSDGSLSNIDILRSPNQLFTDAVVEMISSMPKWKPGRQGDEDVAVKVTLPIRFDLDSTKTK
jgi:TonB family protein